MHLPDRDHLSPHRFDARRNRRRLQSAIVTTLTASVLGCGGATSHQPRAFVRPLLTPPGVNLARTALATVTASSVAEGRGLGDPQAGIGNAFDADANRAVGGENTYWVAGAADVDPTVEVRFDRPVEVSALIVHGGPPYRATLVFASGLEQHTGRIDESVVLEPAVRELRAVRLSFQRPTEGADVRVLEILVLGAAPAELGPAQTPRLGG